MESQERMMLLSKYDFTVNKNPKHIFIVNGKAGAGKTTFEDLILEKVQGVRYSIIDPVKKLLINEGIWDGKDKSEPMRKLMSDIKIALDEYCDFSYNGVRNFIKDFKKDKIPGDVLFIDMREKQDILRATAEFGADVIYIQNDNVSSVLTNVADEFASDSKNYAYSIVIDNSGTYEELTSICQRFADVLINVGGCRERA